MQPTTLTISTDHVDVSSTKSFDATVQGLRGQLGSTGTKELMDRLAQAPGWDEFAEGCSGLTGSSGLIEVGFWDWGGVMTLSGQPTKANCFIVCNPVVAQKFLALGGPSVGLYLPTKMLVYEAQDGIVHVSFNRIPFMAPSARLSAAASVIDSLVATLVESALA